MPDNEIGMRLLIDIPVGNIERHYLDQIRELDKEYIKTHLSFRGMKDLIKLAEEDRRLGRRARIYLFRGPMNNILGWVSLCKRNQPWMKHKYVLMAFTDARFRGRGIASVLIKDIMDREKCPAVSVLSTQLKTIIEGLGHVCCCYDFSVADILKKRCSSEKIV